MRRILPLFVMVGLAGVLVPVLGVMAQLPPATTAPACCSSATGTANKPSATSSTDAKVIDEMIAILKETKSEETFVVTAMALCGIGPEAKRALPQLIRNGERLGLFDNLFGSKASKGDREVAQQVAETIMMLAAGQPMGYLSTTQSVPRTNGSYGAAPEVGDCTLVPADLPGPTSAAPCPAMTGPVVPDTGFSTEYAPASIAPTSTPAGPVPSAPAPTPLPTVKNVSPKGSASRAPAAPAPSPPR